MQRPTPQQQAQQFRELHESARPLVLINAWDAASARLFESSGAPAIATTSAGVAWTLGYSDGEQMRVEELIDVCKRICRVVRIPVSADIERGFGQTNAKVCRNVLSLLDAGVVGINIEDGIDRSSGRVYDPAIAAGRIAAIRKVSDAVGAALFINARTDNYFAAGLDLAARYEDTLARARMYVDAGADGIFVPGLIDVAEISRLAATIGRPLNIYAGYKGVPSVPELSAAGVKRVSLGCGPLQASLALTQKIAVEALEKGSYEAMTEEMLAAGTVNGLFRGLSLL